MKFVTGLHPSRIRVTIFLSFPSPFLPLEELVRSILSSLLEPWTILCAAEVPSCTGPPGSEAVR